VSRSPRSLILVATLGMLVVALAACGRKGALDPPPGGYIFEPGTITTPVTRKGVQRENTTQQPEYDSEGRPVAPEGRKKKLPADILLD
jgi:predicted small lipoprotein YifL